jgi:hypothetical protein
VCSCANNVWWLEHPRLECLALPEQYDAAAPGRLTSQSRCGGVQIRAAAVNVPSAPARLSQHRHRSHERLTWQKRNVNPATSQKSLARSNNTSCLSPVFLTRSTARGYGTDNVLTPEHNCYTYRLQDFRHNHCTDRTSSSHSTMAWKQFEPTPPHLTYLTLTSFLILYALFSLMIRNRLHLSEPPLAIVFGIITGPRALNIIRPSDWGFSGKCLGTLNGVQR